MTKERIRILVDTSRDTGWSNGLIQIEPDSVYQTTNNRDYLSEAVLKNYDVLTICSNTSLKYTDAELELIREFVENGGGLLLASNTSRFARDVREPISELGVNHIASLFGARFLLVPERQGEKGINENPPRIPHGQGEIDIEASPLRSYRKKDLRLTDSEIVEGLGIDDLGLMHCGLLNIPAGSRVFLEHSETREPVGACLHFGSGRVLLINAQLFPEENHPVSGQFIDWLGINRVSLTTGAQTIPDEIPIEVQVREDGKIRILYTHFVEDRVDICMAFAKKLQKDMLSKFPEGKKIEWQISLIPSDLIPAATVEYWLGSGGFVGACVSPSRLAYAFGFEASGLLVNKTPFGKAAYVMSEGFQFFFGIWAMKLLGFEQEAAEILSEFERRFQENTENEKMIDITKVYDQPSHKRTWILKALLEKYGDDLFIRFAEMMSETEGPPDKNMPLTTFSHVDVLIYYLSRVVGGDLFPWFEEIGTTVHPLPLLPNDSAEFVTEVRKRLNGIVRAATEDTSDRIDAIEGLLRIADGSEDGVSELDAADRYERLIAAAKLLKGYDDRAMKVLEALTVETRDDGLVAMAVLMLVRSGRSGGMLDWLVEIAPHQDYRYQLEAGYLLEKMDHPTAKRFSHERIVDENGDPVITMEVEHNKGLHIDAIVEGKRVAIYRADPCTHHFPYNTHVPGIYIGWLHTVPNYRRRGLSQWILEASMSHELVRRYSCISLITGTDNTAHAIYTSLGFVDGMIKQEFTKTLRHEPMKVVAGLVIRPYSHGDEVAMARVSNAFHAAEMNRGLGRARRWRTSETWLIYLAEKDGELLGYLQARCSENGTSAWISEFCLKPQPFENGSFLEGVGTALLSELHNELVKREYEQVSWSSQGEAEKNYVRKLFHNLGYTSTNTNSVWLFRIINLPMLLGELTPLLSKRLSESDAYKNWQGTIGIKGSGHRASLIIRDSEIRISAEVSEGTAIRLSTDDETLTRFILGVFTPYEAYLQSQLHVAPSVNRSVVGLLETLFPARQQVEDRGTAVAAESLISCVRRYSMTTKRFLPEGAKARLGKGWTRHAVYSPDSTQLAVASSIGIWLYDAHSGEVLDLLTGHTDHVERIAYSPDGSTIVSGSYDSTMRLWDVATGTLKNTFEHPRTIDSVAYSPDGNTIVSGCWDNTIRLWDAATGALKNNLTGHTGTVYSVVYSPDGSTIASASRDETIRLWDAATGALKNNLTGHNCLVMRVAYSPDGNTIAGGSRDETVRLWDTATGELKNNLTGHNRFVVSVAYSPDGSTIASGSGDETVRLWDATTGTLKNTLTGHSSTVYSVAYSPDGNTVASVSYDNTVRLWDATTGTLKNTLTGHIWSVYSVAYSPDGKMIASGCRDRTMRLWDAATESLKNTLTEYEGRVYSIAYSPDGRTIANVNQDQIVRLWDTGTDALKNTLTGHTDAVDSVAYSPDGNTIASGSEDKTVRLWDTATGELKNTFEHPRRVYDVAYSPDGNTIVSGSRDTTVRLWDAATGTLKNTFTGHTGSVSSVAYSPDGNTIASGSEDKTVRLWDVATGTLKNTLTGHTRTVVSVAYSPDGNTIASGSEDKTVRLWDVATGTLKNTFTGHTDWIESLAYSPDSSTLTSGSGDGTVLLWDLS